MFRPESSSVRSVAIAATLVVVSAALGACTAPAAATLRPTATPAAASASFTIDVAAPISKTFASDPAAVVSTCSTPTSGPWTFLYTGPAASVSVDLTVYGGAAATAKSNDFQLTIEFGESTGLPVLTTAPSGRAIGAHGSSGTVTVGTTGAGATVDIDGIAFTRPGLQPFTFHLVCPARAA